VVNLLEHWESAASMIKEENQFLSIRAHIWHNMLMTTLHELSHGKAKHLDKESFDAMSADNLDDACEMVARELLEELAIQFDIEPARMAEEPYFGTRYMQLFVESIQNSKEGWAARQNSMHDEVYLYCDENSNVLVDSFRAYLRGAYDPKSENRAWDLPTTQLKRKIAVTPTTEMHAQVLIPMMEPAVPIDIPTLEAQSENIIEPTDVELSPFGNDNWEATAMAHLMGGGGPESPAMVAGAPAGAVNIPAHIAPMPSGPVIPQAHPQPTAFAEQQGASCSLCWTQFSKFCGHCGALIVAANTAPPAPAEQPAPMQMQPAPTWNAPAATLRVQNTGGRINEVLRTGLPQIGLGDQQISQIMLAVWGRMYELIYTKCGFQLLLPQAILANPQADKGGFHPSLRYAVMSGINVNDIPGADKLIIAAQALDHSTMQVRKTDVVGGLIPGFVSKRDQLPMFAIYLNYNGFEIKRVFVPQNPYKFNKSATDYSQYAKRAQAGERIAHIIDGDDRATKTYRGKIVNGVFSTS
jgi:hypothetical protein